MESYRLVVLTASKCEKKAINIVNILHQKSYILYHVAPVQGLALSGNIEGLMFSLLVIFLSTLAAGLILQFHWLQILKEM